MILYSILILLIALLPVLMFLKNGTQFLPASRDLGLLSLVKPFQVSVLIPARNEAESIRPALDSILSSAHPQFEVLVLDDHSEDATANIVQSIASRDPRVKLLQSKELPEGWNGKQHACWQLANAASYDRLLFLDADVRLSSDAIGRCLAEQQLQQAPLVSGFPMQETGTFAEKMLIPLMHYVLLGYLPIDRMRSTLGVGLAAGCGQLFLAEKEAYLQSGGHAAIQSSRHDGIQLPRAFRTAGFRTDIFDATDIARCRMYTSTTQVCNGLLKNATEGIANPKLIVPFSILLLGGSVLPGLSLLVGLVLGIAWLPLTLLAIAFLISFVPRVIASIRFKQSPFGALVHPIGTLWFVSLQWVALFRKQLGLTTKWRGRI
ncbi:MAG: glycosyltransferase family 2 protein [Pirellula staleyi]